MFSAGWLTPPVYSFSAVSNVLCRLANSSRVSFLIFSNVPCRLANSSSSLFICSLQCSLRREKKEEEEEEEETNKQTNKQTEANKTKPNKQTARRDTTGRGITKVDLTCLLLEGTCKTQQKHFERHETPAQTKSYLVATGEKGQQLGP